MTLTKLDRSRADRGSATLELTLIAPALLLFIMLVVAAGRVTTGRTAVSTAARDAARAASLERSAQDALDAADESVSASLEDHPLDCDPIVEVDTSNFEPGGSVRVTVTCNFDVADLGLLDLPGTITVTGDFRETVDAFRGTR